MVTPCNGCYSTFKERLKPPHEGLASPGLPSTRSWRRSPCTTAPTSRSRISRSGCTTTSAPASLVAKVGQAVLGNAPGGPLRVSPSEAAAGRALGRPPEPREGGGAGRRAGRPGRGLHHQDAVLRRRPRPRRRARYGIGVLSSRKLVDLAERRCRCTRRRVPKLLPAVRSQPGRASPPERGPERPGLVPLGAPSHSLTGLGGGTRPRYAPRPVQPFLEPSGPPASRTARGSPSSSTCAELGRCAACGACRDDCPVCKVDADFQPTGIIERCWPRAVSTRSCRTSSCGSVSSATPARTLPLPVRHGRDVPQAQGARNGARLGGRTRSAPRPTPLP